MLKWEIGIIHEINMGIRQLSMRKFLRAAPKMTKLRSVRCRRDFYWPLRGSSFACVPLRIDAAVADCKTGNDQADLQNGKR
jgi:hypothetical protein